MYCGSHMIVNYSKNDINIIHLSDESGNENDDINMYCHISTVSRIKYTWL